MQIPANNVAIMARAYKRKSQFHPKMQIFETVIKCVVTSILQKFLWAGKKPGNPS